MQLITQKLLPPTSVPSLPRDKAQKCVYRLGLEICPSMDLIATFPVLTQKTAPIETRSDDLDSASEDDTTQDHGNQRDPYGVDEDDEEISIEVWRFNGQRVFSITVEDDNGGRAEIKSVQWRHDGQILSILTSDTTIRLVNSFSGKIVHKFSSLPTYVTPSSQTSPRTRRSSVKAGAQSPKSRPLLLSYTTHFSHPASTQSLLESASQEGSVVLDDLLGPHTNISSLLKSPADLPRELTNVDVELFLPRLSCLPPVGFGGEDVFSTRTSIDAIFHASKKNIQSGNIDVLLAGHSEGMASVRIFDSFEVGRVDLDAAVGMRKSLHMGRFLKTAGWPFTSEIFIAAEDSKKTTVHLLSVDLKFITQSSNTLPVLATKATQLQNLLRYLTQIQSQLAREVKTAFDLPMRFLRNVNEDLENQDGPGASFKTAAYHTIVTGQTAGAFKDWLAEQVGDRGVKRWEKSVGDCLELARRLVSEAWCPAVERAGVVVSRLSGLASWAAQHDGEGKESTIEVRLVEDLRNTIDVMAICGEECLREVIQEISEFLSFIKWLKWEVEASTLEDTSEKLDEMREGSDHAEVTKVLDYIQRGPEHSVVKGYLGGLASNPPSLAVEDEDEAGFYSRFKEQQRKQDSTSRTATFEQLLSRMRKQCDKLFEQIAHKLQQAIMTRYITPLSSGIDRKVMDLRVIPHSAGQARVHLVAKTAEDGASILHYVVDMSENQVKTARTERVPDTQEILDVKFVDDLYFMVLVKAAEEVRIYSAAVESEGDVGWELRHCFRGGVMESGMRPGKLEINGRKNRRVVDVIDEEGKGFVVFDLDSGDVEDEEPGGETRQ